MIVHGERTAQGDPDYTHFSLDITSEEWQLLQDALCSGHARLEKEGWRIVLSRVGEGLALRLNINTLRGGLVMLDQDEPIILAM